VQTSSRRPVNAAGPEKCDSHQWLNRIGLRLLESGITRPSHNPLILFRPPDEGQFPSSSQVFFQDLGPFSSTPQAKVSSTWSLRLAPGMQFAGQRSDKLCQPAFSTAVWDIFITPLKFKCLILKFIQDGASIPFTRFQTRFQ